MHFEKLREMGFAQKSCLSYFVSIKRLLPMSFIYCLPRLISSLPVYIFKDENSRKVFYFSIFLNQRKTCYV